MPQTITVKIKLLPTKDQEILLSQMCKDYIALINQLVGEMTAEKKSTKKTTKNVSANLPSVVKNQAIKDAISIFFTKVKKTNFNIIPVL